MAKEKEVIENNAPAIIENNNSEMSVSVSKEKMLTNEVLANVLNSDMFEGEGVDMTSTYLRREVFIENKGKEMKVIFNGVVTEMIDSETGQASDCVLFHSNFEDGKTPKQYKSGASKLVGALKDGGKGLYKVTPLGEKKREGKKGFFLDFTVSMISKIN